MDPFQAAPNRKFAREHHSGTFIGCFNILKNKKMLILTIFAIAAYLVYYGNGSMFEQLGADASMHPIYRSNL